MNGAADVVESLWNMNYWKKTEDVARFVAKQREMDEQAALNYVHKARAWAKANPRAAVGAHSRESYRI